MLREYMIRMEQYEGDRKIRIVVIQGDYDVLIGKRYIRGFDSLWKAKLYRFWIRLRKS